MWLQSAVLLWLLLKQVRSGKPRQSQLHFEHCQILRKNILPLRQLGSNCCHNPPNNILTILHTQVLRILCISAFVPSACCLVAPWQVHHPGDVPPQQVDGVPQGVVGQIGEWLVNGGVVFKMHLSRTLILCNLAHPRVVQISSTHKTYTVQYILQRCRQHR